MVLSRSLIAAAVAGAATMFVWGGFSHMVLLTGVGFSRLPQEENVVAALKRGGTEDGLYFFPGANLRGHTTAEERSAWEARYRAGPTGMLVYHPAGDTPVSAAKLLRQAASHLLAGLMAAYVLSRLASAKYWHRVLVAGLLGGFSWLSVSVIYWNWYGFPDAFFLAQGADMIVGWCLAGAVIARVLPRPAGT